jgi:DNA-binding NarL/FixJ family response regulator
VTSTPIRVLLVDDHAIVREGLCMLLAEEPEIKVVGEASDGAGAVALAATLHPDVILWTSSCQRWMASRLCEVRRALAERPPAGSAPRQRLYDFR